MSEKKKVLFVCTGNICRSPMAEYMLRDKLNNSPLRQGSTPQGGGMDFVIASAGIYGVVGCAATRHVQNILGENGIDCAPHRASQVTQEMLDGCDFIFCMTRGHRSSVQSGYKVPEEKLFWMGEFTGGFDVEDPYYGAREDYEKTFEVLQPAIDKIVEFISKK